MSNEKQKEYTVKEAAAKVGVSDSRIRQMVVAGDNEHKYFGRMIVITEKGVEQAQERNTKLGPRFKSDSRKAA